MTQRNRDDAMERRLDRSTRAVRRWLELHRDVLVVGDEGSGRTTMLGRLAERLRIAGFDPVVVEGRSSTLGGALRPLLGHPIGIVATTSDSIASTLETVFSEKLTGRHPVLVVDDLDHADRATLGVLNNVLRRTDARLVATVGLDYRRRLDSDTNTFISYRSIAEVQLDPLSFNEMMSLLTLHLGVAPPDIQLVSSIMVRSAGNARAAIALVDAGRWSGAIELTEGRWTEQGDLDEAPTDAVTHALTDSLSQPEVDALELLAWTGPIRIHEAVALLGDDLLAALSDRARLVLYPPGGAFVAVSPVELARALRDRSSAVRRQLFRERVVKALGPDWKPDVSTGSKPIEQREEWSPTPLDTLDLMNVIRKRIAAHETAAYAEWQELQTSATARRVIESTLGSRGRVDLQDLFDRTPLGAEPVSTDDVLLLTYEAVWATTTRDLTRANASFRKLLKARGRDDGITDELARARRASSLLEQGRLEEGFALLEQREAQPWPLAGIFDALYFDALLLEADFNALEQHAIAGIAAARSALDPAALRIHYLALVEAQYLTGRYDHAWNTAESALQLGPPGPFDGGYHARLLAFASVLQARAGNYQVSSALIHEIEQVPQATLAPIKHIDIWARAHLLHAQGQTSYADEILWRAGLNAHDNGQMVSARGLWAAMRSTPQPTLVAQLQSTLNATHRWLFMAAPGHLASLTDWDESATALDLKPTTAQLAHTAAFTANGIGTLAAPASSDRGPYGETSLASKTRRPAGISLSSREREVALLARSGYTNRDIANRLFVSVRTVENHIYRALKKLGFSRRTDLEMLWDPLNF